MRRHRALLPAILLVAAACAAPGGTAPVTAPPNAPVTAPPVIDFPLPGDGGPVNVVPKPGQRDVHPVSVEMLEVRVNGDRVAARLTWTSGVEPCYALDSVLVARDGNTITLTVREGSGPVDAVCIEIAQQKSTIVDLGAFPSGTYTIGVSEGTAEPVDVTIP